MEKWRRNFILVTGFFEALLFSGCLFGWPSLLLILQEEGIYGYLCQNSDPDFNTTVSELQQNDTLELEISGHPINVTDYFERDAKVGCDEQRIQMTLIYTFAAVAYGITAVFIGLSLEILGLRVTRLLGTALLTSGFVIMSFATPERSWLLWPALNLIGLGSNQIRFSGLQFADLLPKYRATILTSYSSAFAMSTTFFVLMQLIYEATVPFRWISLFCGGVSAVTFIPTFLMPRHKIRTDNDEKVNAEETALENGNCVNISLRQLPINNGEATKAPDKNPKDNSSSIDMSAVFKTLFSFSGLLHLYWCCTNIFTLFFYSSTLNIWASKVAKDDIPAVSFYIKMYGVCSFIAPIFTPLSGLLTDKMIQQAQKRSTAVEKLAYTMKAPVLSLIGTTVLFAAAMSCKLFINETAVYLSLIFVAFARPVMMGSSTAYLRLRFPAEQFNILNGILSTGVSILCFLQYPITKWMVISDASYAQAHWLLLIILLLSLTNPGHMMIRKNAMKYARQRIKAQKDHD